MRPVASVPFTVVPLPGVKVMLVAVDALSRVKA